MILQLGSLFSGLITGIGAAGANIFSQAGGLVTTALQAGAQGALQVGTQYVGGLVNRELNRAARNDSNDALKAALRAAANAVAPTVAPGQGPVYSGGQATGSAFMPATLIAPSLEPPQRVLRTDPNHFSQTQGQAFQMERRPPDVFVGEDLPFQRVGLASGAAAAGSAVLRGFSRFREAVGPTMARRARQFDPRTPLGRQMLGTAAAATALEAGLITAAIGSREVGEFSGIATEGDPLRVTEIMPGHRTGVAPVGTPTGLPGRGVYQKEANGCIVQWYFFNGRAMEAISRQQAECVKKDCIYRLNVFLGDFQKLKSRRMNPMNVTAFFRSGRRVDAGERICRKMFSEHRKTKTGTVRRKRTKKKK